MDSRTCLQGELPYLFPPLIAPLPIGLLDDKLALVRPPSASVSQRSASPDRQLLRPYRATRTRQRLSKDLAPATQLHTEEPSCLQVNHHRNAVPWQVRQPPHVSAMHLSRGSSTSRTGGGDTARLQPHLDHPSDAAKADQLDLRDIRDQRSLAHRRGTEIARATSVLRLRTPAGKHHQIRAKATIALRLQTDRT